jgi:putative salt-induced outer membrane protein
MKILLNNKSLVFKAGGWMFLLINSLFADPLKIHMELSYMNASGNAETDTFAMKSGFSKKFDKKKSLKGKANGTYVTNDSGDEITNKFYSELDYHHQLTNNFYGYLKTDYTFDKFSGFDYKWDLGPGIGYKILDFDKQKLNFSMGLAYSQDKPKDNLMEDYSSITINSKYCLKISSIWKFKQELSFHQDLKEGNNYSGKSISGLEHKLSSLISLGVSYNIDYQHNAPEKDIDKLFLVSLVIDY